MNSSADKAGRKWPSGWHATPRRPVFSSFAVALVLIVAASAEASAKVPLPQPRPAEAPAPENKSSDEKESSSGAPSQPEITRPAEPSACRQALTDSIAIAPSIPPIRGPGGCGGEDLVRLEAVVLSPTQRVTVKPAAILRCTMAAAVADWVRNDIAPLAVSLGTTVSELDNFDSFECRGRNRVKGAKLSEHGLANALDVRGLKFADGKTLSLTDRTVPRETRERVLASVCARFTTVLGPGSDWYHEDHIHLDLAQRRNNFKLCQWGVYEPMPAIAPLMPAERPDEAPPRPAADGKTAPEQASDDAPGLDSGGVTERPAVVSRPRR